MRLLRKITVRMLAVFALLLFVAALAGVLVVRSGWFREYVRTQILIVLERGTGGRAELGEFSFDWKRLTVQVSSLVVHGKESAEAPPFLQVDSVTIGLRVISAIERNVNLASATVVNPQVHIVVYPDGSTNVPNPGRQSNTNWAEQLVNLRVQKYDIRDGQFEYDNRRVPINIAGENLHVVMDYQPAVPPGLDASYNGEVTSERLRVIPNEQGPIETGFRAAFTLDKSRIRLPKIEFATKESRAELAGTLEDVRAPHGTFDIKATIGIRENVRMFNLPIGPQGSATFNGKLNVTFLPDFDFGMQGRVAAQGLGYVRDRLKIEDATLRADIRMTKDRLTLNSVDANALNAKITGNGELLRWREFKLEGEIAGMDLRRAAGVLTPMQIAWSGSLMGPFKTEATIGENDAKVQADLDLDPSTSGEQGAPVTGKISFNYDQASDTIALGSSWFSTPMTRVDVQGTLGKALPSQTLRVKLRTTNPDDLLPAIAMVEQNPPQTLPLKLRNGVATAEGTVTGQLNDPQFTGQVAITNGDVQNHFFDRFTTQLTASRSQVRAERTTVARGPTEASGSATLTAKAGSFEDADVSASLNLTGASVAELVREAGRTLDVAGTAAATIRVTGSVQNPQADITADVAQPAAYGERFTRLRASVRYRKDAVEITSGTVSDGPAAVQFSGTYRPAGADWQNGNLTFDAATQNFNIARLERVAELKPPVEGTVTGRVRGTAQISNGELVLRSADADIASQNVTFDRKPLGDFSLGVVTSGTDLQALATGKVRDIAIEARGNWTLQGLSPGNASIRFSRMSIATLHSLSMLGSDDPASHEDDVPMEGFVDGSATLTIALRQPKDLKAEVTLDTVQLTPKESHAARLGVQPQDIVLRNEQPVIVDITAEEATIRQARFTGRDTSLQATGSVPLRESGSANISVRGNINLILLQLANPDLLANGDATIQAAMRGRLRNPELNGRLDVKNASLYVNDLPNGFDNANGSILFDRNRATIEKLTAETGGGNVSLAGGVDFSNGLVYRLSAAARQVRVRWPEDLSTTFNANVGLSGTPQSSTLSGTITLVRAAFNPRTDLGQLLAQASRPTPAPSAPNEYLRGLQFDVRIENSPNFGFETSLTRDVEAEVDLRLHGSPLRPSLLGQISVNQGEVQVFGNRYTINRGDIRFLNPVKIEPTFDMDLETRARGITVNVSFSGTMQQLKVNYGSDPPLQSSEIIALLAVGREPVSTTTPTVVNRSSNTAFMEAGGGLIGQAVSQQLSSRLQRFFGASRVKIDPTLTGVDNLPQARLTIEQQVSKDVTLTYITNLNRTQEQLVRVQWDLNRNWSAIAVRDPNGLFGIDFQYRKRF